MKLITVPNRKKRNQQIIFFHSALCVYQAIIGRILVILQHFLFSRVWHQHLQTIQSAAQRRWKN